MLKPGDGGLQNSVMGRYEDELVHDPNEGWLFRSRAIVLGGLGS